MKKLVDQSKLDSVLTMLMLVSHNMKQPISSNRNGMLEGVPFIECDQFLDAKSAAIEHINDLVNIMQGDEL